MSCSDDEEEDDLLVCLDSQGRVEGTDADHLDFSTRSWSSCIGGADALAADCALISFPCCDTAPFWLSCADMGTAKGKEDSKKPRNNLELLAARIFAEHVRSRGPGKVEFEAAASGKNHPFLSLSVCPQLFALTDETIPDDRPCDSGSTMASIGFHWDKDEKLHSEDGIYCHPQLATVTYLSGDAGAPTVVVESVHGQHCGARTGCKALAC
jgi:hypothetical protein